jgi:hypothetical protein
MSEWDSLPPELQEKWKQFDKDYIAKFKELNAEYEGNAYMPYEVMAHCVFWVSMMKDNLPEMVPLMLVLASAQSSQVISLPLGKGGTVH